MKIKLQTPSANKDVQLNMLLLNTNIRVQVARHTLERKTLQYCRASVTAGTATFQMPFGACRCDIDILDGCALIRLWWGLMPVSVAGVANTALGASEIWQFLLDLRTERIKAVSPHKRSPVARRPRITPWIALYLLPEFSVGANARSIRHVQELHKTIGWAIIDQISAQQSRN